GVAGAVAAGSHLLNPGAIHIGWGTRIKPCAVIDAEDGPVWIGENVTIFPHTYVQGPAWIGDGSLIQPGAVIHAGTTIGPVSKVGGEIEGSIIHGFSNKQHDGFLGHSYVGSWVNIAADCINSDLKNTYGTIRVPVNGRDVDTGRMFVGMFVGDYSKAGINVSFPTGAVIGFCSSVFAPRSPKFVPSFAWIDGDKVQRYDEQRGLAIAKKVMARRRRRMTLAEEHVFLAVRRQALAVEKQTLSLES
ncbi:MAG: transferase, partial [Planctomycetaceae bacterium]